MSLSYNQNQQSMPIYEYRCKKCGKETEVLVRSPEKPPTRCRECGGRLEKLISTSAIQFKGEGWYITDYARKGSAGEKAEGEKAEKAEKAEKPEKTEKAEKPAESKPKKDTSSDK